MGFKKIDRKIGFAELVLIQQLTGLTGYPGYSSSRGAITFQATTL
jgi:hypothetical protein